MRNLPAITITLGLISVSVALWSKFHKPAPMFSVSPEVEAQIRREHPEKFTNYYNGVGIITAKEDGLRFVSNTFDMKPNPNWIAQEKLPILHAVGIGIGKGRWVPLPQIPDERGGQEWIWLVVEGEIHDQKHVDTFKK